MFENLKKIALFKVFQCLDCLYCACIKILISIFSFLVYMLLYFCFSVKGIMQTRTFQIRFVFVFSKCIIIQLSTIYQKLVTFPDKCQNPYLFLCYPLGPSPHVSSGFCIFKIFSRNYLRFHIVTSYSDVVAIFIQSIRIAKYLSVITADNEQHVVETYLLPFLPW